MKKEFYHTATAHEIKQWLNAQGITNLQAKRGECFVIDEDGLDIVVNIRDHLNPNRVPNVSTNSMPSKESLILFNKMKKAFAKPLDTVVGYYFGRDASP